MDFGLLYENDKGEYVVLSDVRMADIRFASLVYLLVYVSTYCVPIALLRQNKPFRLLYLGHAQITSVMHVQSCYFADQNHCFFGVLFTVAVVVAKAPYQRLSVTDVLTDVILNLSKNVKAKDQE